MTTDTKTTIEETIRLKAADLLIKGEVDAVIGYRQGSLPYMTEPFMAKTAADAGQLVFNSHCRMNLSAYLSPELIRKGAKGRVAVVAKGCDSRNMVTQIQENRFSRDQVYIIGLPCTGMADKGELLARADGRITAVCEDADTLVLTTESGKVTLAKAEVLQSNCHTCIRRNPAIWDDLAAEAVPELDLSAGRFADVEKIEALSPDEKATFFDALLAPCTRCYACRNACPLCYCPTCFVDESRPQWVGKTVDPTDVMTYHLIRAFHDAGRCTDCGACEAACPMDILLRHFTRKTIRDSVAAFGCEAGMDLDIRPALDRFDLKDPEGFIR